MSNTYLQSLLASQELTPAQRAELDAHKKEVESFLIQEFGKDPMIKIAGSVSKGTANRENYDLDIVVYFPSSDSRTLKEIYEAVQNKLATRYSIESKTSAIRIRSLGTNGQNAEYHIDVVPGKFIENSHDVFLHVRYGDKERMQTNLKTHIQHIVGSGCQDVIRLVKLWKVRNGLSLKTFVLELFVVKTLAGSQSKTNLEASFARVMEAFNTRMRVELVDPANTGNIVSKLLTDADKSMISSKAAETLNVINKSVSGDKWKLVFKEINPQIAPMVSRVVSKPAGQWNSR